MDRASPQPGPTPRSVRPGARPARWRPARRQSAPARQAGRTGWADRWMAGADAPGQTPPHRVRGRTADTAPTSLTTRAVRSIAGPSPLPARAPRPRAELVVGRSWGVIDMSVVVIFKDARHARQETSRCPAVLTPSRRRVVRPGRRRTFGGRGASRVAIFCGLCLVGRAEVMSTRHPLNPVVPPVDVDRDPVRDRPARPTRSERP